MNIPQADNIRRKKFEYEGQQAYYVVNAARFSLEAHHFYVLRRIEEEELLLQVLKDEANDISPKLASADHQIGIVGQDCLEARHLYVLRVIGEQELKLQTLKEEANHTSSRLTSAHHQIGVVRQDLCLDGLIPDEPHSHPHPGYISSSPSASLLTTSDSSSIV